MLAPGHGSILSAPARPRIGQASAMYFVGVDLAWGQRKPTGLAVLDEDGRLVHVSAAGTDDEIVAALAPYVEGDCLVAIDAPLIVPNATGNRPAEADAQPRLRPVRRRRAPRPTPASRSSGDSRAGRGSARGSGST